MKNFKTNDVIVRRFEMNDLEDIHYNILIQDDVIDMANYTPHKNIDESRIILKSAINEYYTDEPIWAVEDKKNKNLVGFIRVSKYSRKNKKCHLTWAVALEECENGKYERILISRNVDNQKLGYLPGSLEEKVDPFLQGIKDNLEILINGTQLSEKTVVTDRRTKKFSYDGTTNNEKGYYFFEKGIIKIQALEMLRGRSVMNTCFIIDEAQNIEPEFIKTIVTRAAKGSKFIFLGDPTQIDNPKLTERRNGIVYLSEKMKNNNLCTVVTLQDSESVRSDLAKVASEIL